MRLQWLIFFAWHAWIGCYGGCERAKKDEWWKFAVFFLGGFLWGGCIANSLNLKFIFSCQEKKKEKFRQIGSKWDFQAILKGFVERNKHRYFVVRHNLMEEFFVIMFFLSFYGFWFISKKYARKWVFDCPWSSFDGQMGVVS